MMTPEETLAKIRDWAEESLEHSDKLIDEYRNETFWNGYLSAVDIVLTMLDGFDE